MTKVYLDSDPAVFDNDDIRFLGSPRRRSSPCPSSALASRSGRLSSISYSASNSIFGRRNSLFSPSHRSFSQPANLTPRKRWFSSTCPPSKCGLDGQSVSTLRINPGKQFHIHREVNDRDIGEMNEGIKSLKRSKSQSNISTFAQSQATITADSIFDVGDLT